jgi:hypothetical protein
MAGQPASRLAGKGFLGWGLAASTLFHLLLFGIGLLAGEDFPAGSGGAPFISVRLPNGESSTGGMTGNGDVATTLPVQSGEGGGSGSTPMRQAIVQSAVTDVPQASPDFSDYFPKPLLDVNPEPLIPVDIPHPDIAGKRIVQIELSVFIDEGGRVRRVRVDTPSLMEPYAAAATGAFMSTPFKPGQIDGRAVKSVIKVLVEFRQL